jgi:RNA polymerase sigma factor (sigma-70 family)
VAESWDDADRNRGPNRRPRRGRVISLQRMGLSTHKQGMTGDQRSDSELLARLPRQPELMGVLYKRHAPTVFRYLARRAGPPAAEDLVSEVFIAALSASSRVVAHDSGSALPWLYGIAMNVLRRHFQKTRPAHEAASDPGVDWDAVDDRLDAWAGRGRLRAALSDLSDSDRELLLLVAWEGLTPAEAAAALDISQTVARSRLHRARMRAMRALQSQSGGGPNVVTTLHAKREAS